MKQFVVTAWVEVEAAYIINAKSEEDAREYVEKYNPLPGDDDVLKCTVLEVTGVKEKVKNELQRTAGPVEGRG